MADLERGGLHRFLLERAPRMVMGLWRRDSSSGVDQRIAAPEALASLPEGALDFLLELERVEASLDGARLLELHQLEGVETRLRLLSWSPPLCWLRAPASWLAGCWRPMAVSWALTPFERTPAELGAFEYAYIPELDLYRCEAGPRAPVLRVEQFEPRCRRMESLDTEFHLGATWSPGRWSWRYGSREDFLRKHRGLWR